MREGRALAEDLAKQLQLSNWMVWVELPLGSFAVPSADVMAVAKSFANPRFVIYEVKASRQDFLADVNRGKYENYFGYCNQLYFATPSGMLKQSEIPSYCGLTVKGEHGWHIIKAARRREFNPSADLMIRLLIRGYQDYLDRYRELERERFKELKSIRHASYEHGIKIAYQLADAATIIEQGDGLRKEIEGVLGKEYSSLSSAVWGLKADIDNLIRKRKFAGEAVELAGIVMSLFDNHALFIDSYPRKLRDLADRIESKSGIMEGGVAG